MDGWLSSRPAMPEDAGTNPSQIETLFLLLVGHLPFIHLFLFTLERVTVKEFP